MTPLRRRSWAPLVRVRVDDLVRFRMGRLDLDSDQEFGAETTRLPVCAGG
jgi:hypothetical protein